jgi:dihydroorotase
VDVFELAWRIAREAGLPLMVHLGMGFNEPISRETIDRFIIRLLGRLEKGDILTHCYTDKPGGVFHMDGTPLSGMEQALSRGVYLDAAPGRGHIHFSLVKAALARGFAPHAFGTDVVRLPEEQPHFYNVTCVASKFIALDLPLSDALAAVSCNPARMLGEQDARGSLQPGMAANISILREHRGEFLFHDGRAGNVIPGSSFLSPQIVIKRGEIVHTRQSYRSHLPTQAWLKAALA